MAVTKEMNAQQDRQKALENAMKQITKEFGAGSIMRLGEMGDKLDIEVIPTGSLALDIAVGVGGYPRGRVIEIYGPESSGKTTLALHAIAEAQKMGGVTAFIDAEHALDPTYAARIGVDIDEVLISQPDTGEQALEIVDMLVRSGAIDAIVVDKPGLNVACGAIGIGEITSIPTAPAIADAYFRWNGERQYSLPLTGTPYERKC